MYNVHVKCTMCISHLAYISRISRVHLAGAGEGQGVGRRRGILLYTRAGARRARGAALRRVPHGGGGGEAAAAARTGRGMSSRPTRTFPRVGSFTLCPLYARALAHACRACIASCPLLLSFVFALRRPLPLPLFLRSSRCLVLASRCLVPSRCLVLASLLVISLHPLFQSSRLCLRYPCMPMPVPMPMPMPMPMPAPLPLRAGIPRGPHGGTGLARAGGEAARAAP